MLPDPPTMAYPLAWPPRRPRRIHRTEGRFSTVAGHGAMAAYRASRPVTYRDSLDRLLRELDRLEARNAVISSNVELTFAGAPRAGRPEPRDPGVAVYFDLDGQPMVLACDGYTTASQNAAEIAAHIEATRAIECYGVATLAEMFHGFAALPPPEQYADDWRATLRHPRSLGEAEAIYRDLMRHAHPDHGGRTAHAATLNAAIAKAREHWAHR